MKTLFFSVALIAFSFLNVAAQQYVEAKINPIGALFQSPDISAEYILSESFGLEGKLGYAWNNTDLLGDVSKSTGFTFATLGKFYFNPDNDADRFYSGLYAKYARNTSKSTVFSDYTHNRVAVGLVGGFKWAGNSGIVLDINLGVGRALVNKYNYVDEVDPFFTTAIESVNIDFISTIALGYRFEL